jgi:hypothetical protein
VPIPLRTIPLSAIASSHNRSPPPALLAYRPTMAARLEKNRVDIRHGMQNRKDESNRDSDSARLRQAGHPTAIAGPQPLPDPLRVMKLSEGT